MARPLSLLSALALFACAESPSPSEASDSRVGPVEDTAHLPIRDASADVSGSACTSEGARPCGSSLGACEAGEQRCVEGRWSVCEGETTAIDETCNQIDDDCDGVADEGLLNACGACGPPPEERCTNADEDCDGAIDEGCECEAGAARPCGSEVGACSLGEQGCEADGWGACRGATQPGFETCNETDDDCDGRVDEDQLNACGACGQVPEEVCNQEDDDCDGAVDEGLLNACGACGEVPLEVCNQEDDDCDGVIDEGRCSLYFLAPDAEAWVASDPLNAPQGQVRAVIALSEGDQVWMLTDHRVFFLDARRRNFTGSALQSLKFPEMPAGIRQATSVPAWWGERHGAEDPRTVVNVDTNNGQITYFLERGSTRFLERSEPMPSAEWDSPLAPRRAEVRGAWIDLLNPRDSYPGSPAVLCERGAEQARLGPSLLFVTREALHTFDAGFCFAFAASEPLEDWGPARLPNAPPFDQTAGAAHYDAEDGGAPTGHYVWVNR